LNFPEFSERALIKNANHLDFPSGAWQDVVAPIGTPAGIVDTLNAKINEIVRSPELQPSLARLGLEAKGGSPQDFAALIADETPKWAAT
jgi:tripartite-type tricarboxylate transporter receptor subunit TctC